MKTNRLIPVLVSVFILFFLNASALHSQAYAAEIVGTNSSSLKSTEFTFQHDAETDDLHIVTDEQFKAIPLSAFYQLPVEKENFKGISQGFSRFHPGIDIRAKFKSGIKPIQTGTVEVVGVEPGGYGSYVVIKHESGIQSLYAHLDKVTIKKGDLVSTSTVIGTVGMTGRTTGPHVHFEVHTSGESYINPTKLFPSI